MKHLLIYEDYNTLNEIGDLSAGYYNVTGPLFDYGGKRYTVYKFETKSGLKYDVVFYDKRSDIEVWFETFGDDDKQLPMHTTTDKGELYKVMATTFGIINHYLTAKGAGVPFGMDPELTPKQIHSPDNNLMTINPTKEKKRRGRGYGEDIENDKRREKLYMTYLKKQGYKPKLAGDTIFIDLKKYM